MSRFLVSGLWRRALAGFACGLALLGCRSDESSAKAATPAPENPPERFEFTLPSGYERMQLRGEGSESLRAPAGARVSRNEHGFSVEAGADFAIELMLDSPALSELAMLAAPGVARVLVESDTVVLRAPDGGYSFAVVRELVPEWDETQRQRIACGSAGGVVGTGATRAGHRSFTRAAVQNMVAACRTVELPALE